MPPKKAKKGQNASNSGHVSTKTAAQRATEFPDQLYADKGFLFCKFCSVSIDHRRRSTIIDHVNGSRHNARKTASENSADGNSTGTGKRQVTLATVFENASKKARCEVVEDLVYALTASDIPLEKVEKPAFREFLLKHVVNAGSISSADYLRKTKVELVYGKQRQIILSILKDADFISIMADETTDVKGRPLLNIIAVPCFKKGRAVSEKCNLVPYLIDTVELPTVNATEIAGAVLRCVAVCNIPYSKISCFVTDNVNYMGAAFAIIKALCANCVHVGCWAHIFSLVGECWRKAFPDIDKFVTNMKKLFNLSRKKKRMYVETLAENGVVKPKNPPMPVITRWSSWLEAVQQHSENFECYPFLVEKLEASNEDTIAFEIVKEMLAESLNEIRLKLRFIATLSVKICEAVKLMESRSMAAHKIYNYAQDLLQWLLLLERKDFLLEVKTEGFNLNESKRIAGEMHDATVSCRRKLQKYIDGGQPAIQTFKATRCFDPFQIASLPQTLKSYTAIGEFAKPDQALETQWGTYLDSAKDFVSDNMTSDEEESEGEVREPTEEEKKEKASKKKLQQEKKKNERERKKMELTLNYWFAMADRTPTLSKIAIRCLSLPLSSVDVERSFSTLGDVLTDKRQNLTVENVKYLCALYFNSVAVPLL